MAESKTVSEQEGIQVYELGLHLVSSIPSEKANEVWEVIHTELGKIDAEIISEQVPQMVDLVYTMIKNVQGKNVRYNNAHFSWIKFATTKDNVATIKLFAETHPDTLRSIIIKTVRENTLQGNKFAEASKSSSRREPSRPEEVKPVSEVEVDKAIDNIVTE